MNEAVLPLVKQCAGIALDKKGEDPVILDLTELFIVDYFLIVTGHSEKQLSAIASSIAEEMGKQIGKTRVTVEGSKTAGWLLVDCIDFVVHCFTPEVRSFYDLELLWGDAPRVDLSDIEQKRISA